MYNNNILITLSLCNY